MRVDRHLFVGTAACLGVVASSYAVQVVPGTPSFVNLHAEGSARVGATPLTWNLNKYRLVGANATLPSNPPSPGDWTVDSGTQVIGVPGDYAKGRSVAEFGYDYATTGTLILARSSSFGEAVGVDNAFNVRSTVNGRIELVLAETDPGERGNLYDVAVAVRLTGSQLSALGNAAAQMKHSIRFERVGGASQDWIGAYTDTILPPRDASSPGSPFLLTQTLLFTGVRPGETFAYVTLGVGGTDGFFTDTSGLTGGVPITQGFSLFDSTLSIGLTPVLVPTPGAGAMLVLGSLMAARRRRR